MKYHDFAYELNSAGKHIANYRDNWRGTEDGYIGCDHPKCDFGIFVDNDSKLKEVKEEWLWHILNYLASK